MFFCAIYIVIYFLIKGFKIYKNNHKQKNVKDELLKTILASEDKDKINLILKYLKINSTYDIAKELNLDITELNYILKMGKTNLLSNLLLKKIKGN